MNAPNWKRFSLRTLFALMTACCLALGLWSVYVDPYRVQAEALAVVNRLNGEYSTAPAVGPAWQRWLVTTMLGDEAFLRVTKVNLGMRKVDDAALRSLAGLTHLEDFSLDFTPITDDGTTVFASMKNLNRLSLRYTKISDGTAARLAALPKLHTVFLTGTKLTDAAIPHLTEHTSLAELYIRWTGITEPAADQLIAARPQSSIHYHALVKEQ